MKAGCSGRQAQRAAFFRSHPSSQQQQLFPCPDRITHTPAHAHALMTDARTHTSFRFPKFSTPGTGGLLGWAWACAAQNWWMGGIAARPNANRNRAPSPAAAPARPMENRRRVRAEGRGKKTTHTPTPTRRCPSQVLALGSGSVCWHFSHPSIHQSIGVSQSVGRQCPRLFFLRGVGPKEVASPSLPPRPAFFRGLGIDSPATPF